MVVDRSTRACLLCGRSFEGRTFLCRECSDRYRGTAVPAHVRKRFYEALDRTYPERANTYGDWNAPVALLRVIDRLPRHASVLELGSGGGFLGVELRRSGFTHVVLSDITTTALAALRENVPDAELVGVDAASLPFRDGAFDVVISSDVIEHLPHIEQHVTEVARVLAPGGLYLLKTPNRLTASAYYRLRGLHDAYFWHPSMLSPREARDLFARHGFRARILPQPSLTNAQLAKLPGPRFLRPLAARAPLAWLPAPLRPHLEIVARKSVEQPDATPKSLRFTGERVLPGLPEMRVTYLQSLAAYEFALGFASGQRVLDCGCGEGYGSALLAETAAEVVGLDRDDEVVEFAAAKYAQPDRLRFVASDAERLPFDDGAFDLITCFQVLEHLHDARSFLREARRVLAPGGALLLTTPNVLVAGERPNPHHVHDYRPDELRALLH
ncbi:MAG TPA: methyltransferase domain-containing protein, partial [Thermomicrobiales bacterium]|nr:methyltransferase domain-containing protein [Thermomicrobiales bacterium]